MKYRSVLLVMVCAMAASEAVALEDFMRQQPTVVELMSLPKYCAARVSDNQKLMQPYNDLYGQENFVHVHHYCYGLNQINRYFKTSNPAARAFLLKGALSNYDYTLRNVSATFPLRAEMLVQKGRALILARRNGEASAQFLQAIELKPDYVPAYVQLSNFYEDAGNVAKAREVLQDGLKQVPDSQSLQRRLTELNKGSKGK
jgi:tetratricopeptide (TPR) repeat protein